MLEENNPGPAVENITEPEELPLEVLREQGGQSNRGRPERRRRKPAWLKNYE